MEVSTEAEKCQHDDFLSHQDDIYLVMTTFFTSSWRLFDLVRATFYLVMTTFYLARATFLGFRSDAIEKLNNKLAHYAKSKTMIFYLWKDIITSLSGHDKQMPIQSSVCLQRHQLL